MRWKNTLIILGWFWFVVILLIIKAILLCFSVGLCMKLLLVIKQIINRNHLLYSLHDTIFHNLSFAQMPGKWGFYIMLLLLKNLHI